MLKVLYILLNYTYLKANQERIKLLVKLQDRLSVALSVICDNLRLRRGVYNLRFTLSQELKKWQPTNTE